MLDILLAPLLCLTPQAPTQGEAPAKTAGAQTFALPERWLPARTLVSLCLAPIPTAGPWTDLLATDEAVALTGLTKQLLPQLATDPRSATVTELLRHGVAVGLLGVERGQPDLLLVTDMGGAAAMMQEKLAALPAAPGSPFRRLKSGKGTILLATAGNLLVAGTVERSVLTALNGLKGSNTGPSTGQSLADDAGFAASTPTATQLGRAFVRVTGLLELLQKQMPTSAAAPVRRMLHATGLEDVPWLAASWQLEGADLVGSYRLGADRLVGLFDALAGTPGLIDQNLARFVPPNASGFGFFAVDAGAICDQILTVVGAVEPEAGKAVDNVFAQIEAKTGLDARSVLFGGLAGRIVSSTLDHDEFGLLIELEQGVTFAKALSKVVPALPVQLQAGTCAGIACWRLPTGSEDISPALAIAGNWLAIGSTDMALTQLVRQVQQPQPNPTVLAFLRALPPDITWASSGPAVQLPGPWFAAARERLTDVGQRRTVMHRGERGVAIEDRVAVRDLLKVAAAVGAVAATQLAGAPTRTGTPPPDASGSDPEAVATIARAEKAGPTDATVPAIEALLQSSDAKVVARAAWLLGQWKILHAAPHLCEVVTQHESTEVRVQAMAALARVADESTLETVIAATNDQSRQVRTLAVQALARTRVPAAADAARAVIDRFGSQVPREAPTDLVAALTALHDIGDPQGLLPAASAIGFEQTQVGQALAYLFQGLSPKLPPKEEATVLMAVLDHPDASLRRYAIQRLGDLRDPTTARALEGRLVKEDQKLQPLLRVSLAQVRGETMEARDGLVDRAKNNVSSMAQMVSTRWAELNTIAQLAVIGCGSLGVLTIALILWFRHRRRVAATVAEAAALVEPSAGFVQRDPPRRSSPRSMVGVGGREESHR